jgi:hypothetical protein
MPLLPPQNTLNKSKIQIIEQQSVLLFPQDMRSFAHPHPEDKFPIGYLQKIFFTPYHMEVKKKCDKEMLKIIYSLDRI